MQAAAKNDNTFTINRFERPVLVKNLDLKLFQEVDVKKKLCKININI